MFKNFFSKNDDYYSNDGQKSVSIKKEKCKHEETVLTGTGFEVCNDCKEMM